VIRRRVCQLLYVVDDGNVLCWCDNDDDNDDDDDGDGDADAHRAVQVHCLCMTYSQLIDRRLCPLLRPPVYTQYYVHCCQHGGEF